jgi:nitric oxide reductase NorQ protein
MATAASTPVPTTLKEQVDLFAEVNEETIALGETPNGFFTQMYKTAQERLASGDTTPLSTHPLRAIEYQKTVNSKTMLKKGVKPGSFGKVKVEDEAEEKKKEEESLKDLPTTRFVKARVKDGKIEFDRSSKLTWVPNEAGLEEGQHYVLELKSADGVETLTNARVAAPFADAIKFASTGKVANVVMKRLFNENIENAIHVPVVDPTFFIEKHVENFFQQIYAASENVPQKVIISGPQGTGKTTVIEQMAARNERGFFRISCGMIEAPSEWFGFRDFVGDELTYIRSAFIEACETPNTDICLDEFNRLHTTLQNGLYNILDDNGEAWLDMIKRNIRVAAGVVFWATANIGVAHTGTFQIDAAMEDRFAYHLKMGDLPEEDEIRVLMMKTGIGKSLAKTFVNVAKRVREAAADENRPTSKPLSLRQLTAVCSLVVGGMKPIQAVEFTIMPKYSEDGGSASEQAEVRQIFQGVFAGR